MEARLDQARLDQPTTRPAPNHTGDRSTAGSDLTAGPAPTAGSDLTTGPTPARNPNPPHLLQSRFAQRFAAWATYWKRHRAYLAASTVILVLAMVLGYAFSQTVQGFTAAVMQELGTSVGFETRGWDLFLRLLANNLTSAVVIVATGLLFGVYPVLAVVVNGLAIGSLLAQAEQAGFSPLALFLRGVMPHGLFEFPAMILTATYGLVLGSLAARSLLRLLIPSLRTRAVAWGEWLRQLPMTAAAIVLLFVLAAAVEASLTGWLMASL